MSTPTRRNRFYGVVRRAGNDDAWGKIAGMSRLLVSSLRTAAFLAALVPCAFPRGAAAAAAPAPVAIAAVQGPGGRSPLAGSFVWVRGAVTLVASNGFFLQAPDSEARTDRRAS